MVTVGQAVIRGMSNLFPVRQKNYIRSLIGHRGITHSFVPVVALPLITALISYSIGYAEDGFCAALGLAAGILSHLLFDMLAGGAVEWLFRAALIIIFACLGREVIWQM